MEDYEGKVVVVTGAAAGIGMETALAFAGRGADIAVCDINGGGLREVQARAEEMGRRCYREVVDVSQAWQVREFSENVLRELGRVDVLVNNAGVACGGRIEGMSLDDWQWIVGANLWGVVHGCHFFYPRMIEQAGGGHIVNISSCAAFGPMPLMTAYCTTKSAVLNYSKTLRAEASLHGIGVSAVCPGFVSTGIVGTGRFFSGTRRSSPDELLARINRFFIRLNASPERVVRAVMRAVEKDRGVVRAGFEAHLVELQNRLAPRLVNSLNRRLLAFAERWL